MQRAAFGILVFLLAAAASAAEPRGPAFGNGEIRSAIRGTDGPDEDDFVSPLIAGESLGVAVSAAEGSPLLPSLRLLDPAGEDRTPEVRVTRGGRRVGFPRFAVDRSGRWTVRVSGRDGTEGAYAARFRVRRAPAPRFSPGVLGGPAPPMATHSFEGVEGALLTIRARAGRGGDGFALLDLEDPEGDAVPRMSGAVRREGPVLRLDRHPLAAGAGAYRATFGLDEGECEYALSLRVDPPRRPRGRVDLSPEEPRLDARSAPLQVDPGHPVRLRGSGFSPYPLPRVLFGGREAAVLSVGPDGTTLDAVPPAAPAGTLAEVAVRNPDGQASARDGYFLYPGVPPSGVRAFEPPFATVAAGETIQVTVTLSGYAPGEGAVVALATTGRIGSVPATVPVPPYALQASFPFTAGTSAAEGTITASLHGTVSMLVTVTGPPPPAQGIDLSGWQIVQTSSSRTFTLPGGTVLPLGGTLVVGRNAKRAAFEAFWGVTFGPEVVYLDGADQFPSINGDETFALRDPSGTVVDGPTIPLVVGTDYRRTPGAPAGAAPSWTTGPASPGTPGPGAGPGSATGGHGVFVSEFSDASGTGNFIYEFVELHFDGSP